MGDNRGAEIDGFKKAVDSSCPRDQIGMYWGYKVRYCSNLSSVIRNCPYKGGYDHIIGTSEHGLVVSSSELKIPSFRHLLIVFGGLGGLEENIEEDNSLKENFLYRAMLELDQILRPNEINFAVLTALPAFFLSLVLLMLVRAWVMRDKSAEGRGRVARRQRRLLVVEVERRLVQFQTCMDQGKSGKGMTEDDKNALTHPTAERRLREDILSGKAELEDDHHDVEHCPPHELAMATHDEPEEVENGLRSGRRRRRRINTSRG
ncbi:hypothetical protein MUK42_03493 [Musa troglodytarum]|uniref:Uncharacterized protein n=1 Tax=Musa troglodytarum TaxID=320322 RepID=A0A9E7KJK2_9LILI|nr:hypothetical protein MUK42_03493 [Musa troglodytarum]